MAMSVASQSRDNLLEALRVQTEERKNEVKENFLELRTALGQYEEGVDRELSELYSNTRERVERDGKKIEKLEKAKFNLQTDLVDNEFNSILQSTLDNFDAQIAEIRRCSVAIPTDVKLEWHKKELKSSILKVCKIVSSDNVRNSDGRNPAATATQDLENKSSKKKLDPLQKECEKLREQNKKLVEESTRVKNQSRAREEEMKRNEVERDKLAKSGAELKKDLETKAAICAAKKQLDKAYDECRSKLETRDKECKRLEQALDGKARDNLDLSQQLASLYAISELQGHREDDQQKELMEKREGVTKLQVELKTQGRRSRLLEEEWQRESEGQKAAIKLHSDQVSKMEKICESLRRENDSSLQRNNVIIRDAAAMQHMSQLPDTPGELGITKQERDQLVLGNNSKEGSKQKDAAIQDPASGTAPTTRSTKQTKYKYTNILFAKKRTLVYSLDQVENPKDQLGGIVLCRSNIQKHPSYDYVAGTLKTIIHPKFKGDKSIAGVEFLDPLGSCDGKYNDRRYFTSQPKHAAFISLDQIYIACKDAV